MLGRFWLTLDEAPSREREPLLRERRCVSC
jgi:hypothetical protein